jgi:hypothetical protein
MQSTGTAWSYITKINSPEESIEENIEKRNRKDREELAPLPQSASVRWTQGQAMNKLSDE